MRTRFWLFAAAVAAALAANLALVSTRIAQTAEDSTRSLLTLGASGVRAQLELVDLRASPRLAALSPDLIEAARSAADPSQASGRPDERALRAAAAALQPEPDLLVVAGPHGAAVSRRGKAASLGEDAAVLPLAKSAQETGTVPPFATIDGKLYRVSAARTPGNAAVVITGTLIDDRLAEQIRSQIEDDVSFLRDGAVVASSLPPGEARAALAQWAKSPGPGYGTLSLTLPFIDTRLTGKLPVGASRAATRGTLLQLAPAVQAAVTIPAPPPFVWLARYQASYAAGWVLFLLVTLVWGLAAFRGRRDAAQARLESEEPAPLTEASERSEALVGADVSAPSDAARRPPPPSELPWSEERSTTPLPQVPSGSEPLDLDVPPAPVQSAGEGDPIWSADPFPPAPAALSEVKAGASDLGMGWATPPAGSTPEPMPAWAEAAAKPEAKPPPPRPAPPRPAPPRPAPPQKDVTLSDFALPEGEKQDPDEAHFRETFEKFVALREETGEAANLSYEKFAAKLRKNREELLARGTAKSVRFSVYKKDGRAAIKASALR